MLFNTERTENKKPSTFCECKLCALNVSQSDKSIFCTFIIRKAGVLKQATFALGTIGFAATRAGIVWSDWHFLKTRQKKDHSLLISAFISPFGVDCDPLGVRVEFVTNSLRK